MVKDIKTKEVIKDIRTADRKKNLEYFEKKDNVKSKQNLKKDESKSNEQMNPKNYAADKTVSIEKQTAMNTGIKTKGLIKRRKKAQKQKDEQSQRYIKDKTVQKNKIKTKDKKAISTGSKEISSHSRVKIRKNHSESFQTINSKNYNQRMKLQMITKHKKKVKETKETSSALSSGANVTFKFLKGTYGAVVKKAATGVNNIITIGTGLILLMVITLFIGVFSALSDDSSIDTSSAYVSEEVLAYTATIKKYAKEYEISDYVPLIQAVMMQESGGKGNDPMQSSECGFNEKYPQKSNGITDPDYSIKVGIHYLAECLKKASVKNTSDIENISLALQGYNYGNGYIQWAIDHFGGYTRANAKVFSDEMKAKLQTNVYGDPEYVSHVLRYYHLKDIVSIAKTQIGNTGSKYWKWYGFKSRVSWCMIFVSYCASESGDLNKSIYKTASVNEEMSWFKNHDKWKERNYTPSSGDIIFFDWEQNGYPDHVGIVEKVEDGKVYTIEGNSSDEVKAKSYNLESKSIYGYGIN